MGESTDYRLLESIKVVGLSTMVTTGSYDRVLAGWGIEVIKVGSVSGDMFRSFPKTFFVPCTMDEDPSFDNLNAGKRDIVLDLKTLRRIDVIYRLLADADVLLTNTKPKALECLGLDYAFLKEAYPELIMASVNGFGEKGPKKDSPGFDTVTLWISSGFNADMMVDGPGSYPVYNSAGSGDIVTTMGLCYAVTAAPYEGDQIGLGDHASSFLYGAVLWCFRIVTVITEKQYGYTRPRTRENSAPTGAPSRTKDNKQVMTIIPQIEEQWPILCNALGVPGLGTGPKCSTAIKQRDPEMGKYLMERSEEIYETRTTDEWCRILTDADIINDGFAHHKDMEASGRTWANGYVHEVACPNGKESTLARLAMRSEKMGIPQWKREPMLGEHTEGALKGYGYMDGQTEKMRKKGTAIQLDVSGYLHLDQSSILPDGMIGFSDGGWS